MIIDKIWEYIDRDQPFTIHLSDGRSLYVRDHHWIGAHPSRKSSSITIYGPTDDEEHYVPLLAITSLDNRIRHIKP